MTIDGKWKSSGILVTANASVKDRTSFVCTAQLYSCEIHLFPTTSRTSMLCKSFCPFICSCQVLDCRSFCPQCRRECTRFGFRDDSFRDNVWKENEVNISQAETSPSETNSPRLRAPQILQTMSFVGSPDDSSNKFPQSLQKIKDPIADILTSGGLSKLVVGRGILSD